MNANCLICILSDDILQRFVDLISTTQPLLWNNGPYTYVHFQSFMQTYRSHQQNSAYPYPVANPSLTFMARKTEKSYKTSVKRSIEITKSYKVELSFKLNVVAGETLYCHFATG
jgi:hypothetical protein